MAEETTINAKTNYYDLLGIKKEASSNDIKKAYFTLAMQYHPDKNFNNKEECVKNFQKINQAYQVLSNDDQRKLYNFLGAEDYKKYKNQNSNFQTFFESAFKIKTNIENNEKHHCNKSKSFNTNSNSKQNQKQDFQKVFQNLFDDDSSSDEDEETSNNHNQNGFSYYNKFSMNYNFQQNVYFQNFQTSFQQTQQNYNKNGFCYQSDEKFSSNFTGFYQEKPHVNISKKPENPDDQLLLKIKEKKPIFAILRNEIRKTKKNGAH